MSNVCLHCKLSLTKLPLVGNTSIIPGPRVSDIPAGDGKIANPFYSVFSKNRSSHVFGAFDVNLFKN